MATFAFLITAYHLYFNIYEPVGRTDTQIRPPDGFQHLLTPPKYRDTGRTHTDAAAC